MKRPALHAWALLALAVTLAAGPLFAQEPGGYQPARAALEATKRQALNELLQGQLRDAQASLEEKTRARNPSGMATYSEAVALLESALREVQGLIREGARATREGHRLLARVLVGRERLGVDA